MGVSTASHIDPLIEAFETGKLHGEHTAQILQTVDAARRPALIEAAAARLRSFVISNIGTDARIAELLSHAENGFAEALR
jgi:hypothetical protein